jgi:hypothetical protein
MCWKFFKDIVYHHLLLRGEGGGGLNSLKCNLKRKVPRIDFPKEQGPGKFNLVKNIDFPRKLMARFNLV